MKRVPVIPGEVKHLQLMENMSTRKTICLIAGLAALIGAAACAGCVGWNMYYDRKVPNFAEKAELYVYPGDRAEDVLQYLADSCGVRKPASLRRSFRSLFGTDGTPVPGHYVITPAHSSMYVARMLARGWQTPVRLVLSGTMRSKGAVARKVAAQLLLDSAAVAGALDDSVLLAGYGFRPDNVFGLIMPDTYEVFWTDPVSAVLDRQKAAYDAFWSEANREKARAQGLTPAEVSILASIVDGETNYEPEMPAVAGVYLNRLRRGMKLQADPTVAYCLDYKVTRILKKHLEIDSPFNTYLYEGLPPAPICVPTRSALEAVLNPDGHGYLYFCASPDFSGTHRFAATYPEHLRNARAWQQALNARQKANRQNG